MKYSSIVFIFFSLLIGSNSYGQCVDTLYLGSDTSLCTGQTLQLNAGNGYWQYLWNTSATTPSITVSTTGNYSVHARYKSPANLVFNGDFSFGGAGYLNTNYIPGYGGPWGLLSYEGTYAVSTNSNLTHNNFASCTDHTTGTGNMMVVNGASILNQSVWYQTVYCQPNTDYVFSAWFTSVVASSPAILNFRINGSPIGPLVNVSPTTCNWQNFYQIWNSGSNTTATISLTNQNNATGGNDFAIDDIFFGQICDFYDTISVSVLPYPIVNIGSDTTLCNNDSLLLDAGNSSSTYLWNTGATSQQIYADSSGTYSVNVSNGPCFASDTLNLSISTALSASISSDTLLCDTATINLTSNAFGGQPPYDYLWSNLSTSQSIVVNPTQSTTYSVDVSDQCSDTIHLSTDVTISDSWFLAMTDSVCIGDTATLSVVHNGIQSIVWGTGETTFTIKVPNPNASPIQINMTDIYGCDLDTSVIIILHPPFELLTSPDTIVCQGDTLTLSAINGQQYLWSDNSTNASLAVPTISSASYSVTANDNNGCRDTAEILVQVLEYPILSYTVDDDTICKGESTNIFVDGASSYLWNTGDQTSSILISPIAPETQYIVTGYNEQGNTRCSSVQDFIIYSESCNNFYIPNAFTPNNDGLNDEFGVVGAFKYVESFEIFIFDRWGKVVFHTKNINEFWNGRFQNTGSEVSMGVYTYHIVIEEFSGQSPLIFNGTVTALK